MKRARQSGVAASLSLAATLLLRAAYPAMPAVAAETPTEREQVTIETFAFAPHDLTVAQGTTVAWINKDETPHTIVSDDKSIRSQALDTGDAFVYRFTTPGTYAYHCSLHPQMTGRVIVR